MCERVCERESVCVCERERQSVVRESVCVRERETKCVRESVRERERERERNRVFKKTAFQGFVGTHTRSKVDDIKKVLIKK